MGDWVTLVVEVGRSQSWESLLAAAELWVNYVECILLLGVRPRARLLQYALYDAAVPCTLPPPTAAETIHDRPAVGTLRPTSRSPCTAC